jgi:hypothetical protein
MALVVALRGSWLLSLVLPAVLFAGARVVVAAEEAENPKQPPRRKALAD